MNTLTLPNGVTRATDAKGRRLEFDDEMLHCELEDSRVISVPLSWYPRLCDASPEQRNDYEIIAGGYGVHWPQLDEDLLVSGFMTGCDDSDEQPTAEPIEVGQARLVGIIKNASARPSVSPFVNFLLGAGKPAELAHNKP